MFLNKFRNSSKYSHLFQKWFMNWLLRCCIRLSKSIQTMFETGGPLFPACRLKTTCLVLIQRTIIYFKDPRKQLTTAMKFGTTMWLWVNARSVTRWEVVHRSKAFFRVYCDHITWRVWIRSTAHHGTVWSQERKQYPQLCFPNKFEHEEEDVRNIIRVVGQQEDHNHHCAGNLFGWPA